MTLANQQMLAIGIGTIATFLCVVIDLLRHRLAALTTRVEDAEARVAFLVKLAEGYYRDLNVLTDSQNLCLDALRAIVRTPP